jgi:AraC-like DNA-binding protein
MPERLFLRLDDDPLHGPEADVPEGSLRAFAVPPALHAQVAHILQYRETVPPGHEVPERVLPDGAVRLVFNFGDAPRAQGEGGPAAPAQLIGASATPVVVRLRGRVDGISVTLRPGAAAALLGGVPAGEFAERVVPLEAVWRAHGIALWERMAEAATDAARVVVLQDALIRQLQGRDRVAPPAALQAARLITEAGGQRPLSEVAAALGVGERRLQQLFHAHVGLSPRAWSRLARLHGCLRTLRTAQATSATAGAAPTVRPSWADLAVQSGYYDQSHLVNEFRALCGMTPTEFVARAGSGPGTSISGSSKTAS